MSGPKLSSYEIKRRAAEQTRVNSLNMQCSNVEIKVKALLEQLKLSDNCIKNRSTMNSSELQGYLNDLNKKIPELEAEKQRLLVLSECNKLQREISSLFNFLGEQDNISKSNIKDKSIGELSKIRTIYKQEIPKLEKRKADKIRMNIEKKIADTVAKFDVQITKHISSKSTTKKRPTVERHSFNLSKYKSLVKDSLADIKNIEFISKYSNELDKVNDEISYKIWITSVTKQQQIELLMNKFSKEQNRLNDKLPLLPSGPMKNSLKVEIEKLTNVDSWGDDQSSWESLLTTRTKKLSKFIDNELEILGDEQYVNECLMEAFKEQGIIIDTTDNNNKYSMIGKTDGIDSHLLGITIDYNKNTFSFQQVLSGNNADDYKNLAKVEQTVCPKIYGAMDKMNDFGITNKFTLETPPIGENEIIVNQKSTTDIDKDNKQKQQDYQRRQQQRAAQMQKSIN
jgi:hypothetical protein